MVHGFKDEEACLRARDLPNCSMVVLFRIGIRLWSATERGCSSCWDGQLREDLGQRVRLTKTKPQTKTGTWQTLCWVGSMPGGDARRRKRKTVREGL